MDKCTFGMSQVQYIGYIIDEKPVYVDLTKIQFIWDCLTSTTLAELHNFWALPIFIRVSCWDYPI